MARSGGPPVETGRPPGTSTSGAAGYLIESRAELRDLIVTSLSDASGELTLFGLQDEGRLAGIVESLNRSAKPELGNPLEGQDRMVHLVFGVDLGYYDSIVVAGRGDDDDVRGVAERYQQAATAYEQKVSNIRSIAEFLVALQQLRAAEG
jgi:hypothetical protein